VQAACFVPEKMFDQPGRSLERLRGRATCGARARMIWRSHGSDQTADIELAAR
jgi:hypothetical protein